MQRRHFVRNISLGALAAGFIPTYGLANFLPQTNTPILIPLENPVAQIRHGALNFPLFTQSNPTLPFDWLLQVHRNIFFKNGFQRSEQADLEIISILLKDEKQEAEVEALQIQLDTRQTTLMIGEDLVELALEEGLQKVKEENTERQLYIGYLKKDKTESWHFPEGVDLYLQVLEGTVFCKEQELTINTGMALNATDVLNITASENSRLLILTGQSPTK